MRWPRWTILCPPSWAEKTKALPSRSAGAGRREKTLERRQTRNNDCLFCAIIDGEIPSNKVYEDEQCYAFYDIDPQAPTHFLVVPKEHICCANAITADNSAVVAHCFEVIVKICKELGVESYRIVNNCGDQAGQTVKHLHFHVLAGRDMTWPPG